MKLKNIRGVKKGFESRKKAKRKRLFDWITNSYIPKGDQLGIMLGYYGIYKEGVREGNAKYADVLKNGTAKEKREARKKIEYDAIQKFETYESTQQPRDPLYMNAVQMQSGMLRLTTMFKSSQMLYFNKTAESFISIKRDVFNKRKPKAKDVRKFLINGWISNILFQSVAALPYAILGDWDDYRKKMNRALTAGPINGMFIVGDVAQWFFGNKLAGDSFDLSLTRKIGEVITDPINAIDKGFKEKDFTELAKGLAIFAAYTKGIPAPTLFNIMEGIYEAGEGDMTEGVLRMMGWTDWQIEDAIGRKEDAIKKKEEKDEEDPTSYMYDDEIEEAQKKWFTGKFFKGKEDKDEEWDPVYGNIK